VVSLTTFVGLTLATEALTIGGVSSSPNLDVPYNVLVLGLIVTTIGIMLLRGLNVSVQILTR
jgi:hypothetical protein